MAKSRVKQPRIVYLEWEDPKPKAKTKPSAPRRVKPRAATKKAPAKKAPAKKAPTKAPARAKAKSAAKPARKPTKAAKRKPAPAKRKPPTAAAKRAAAAKAEIAKRAAARKAARAKASRKKAKAKATRKIAPTLEGALGYAESIANDITPTILATMDPPLDPTRAGAWSSPWSTVGEFAFPDGATYDDVFRIVEAWQADLRLEKAIGVYRIARIRVGYIDPKRKLEGEHTLAETGPWGFALGRAISALDPADDKSLASRYGEGSGSASSIDAVTIWLSEDHARFV